MQQKWNQNFDGEPMTDIPQKFLNAGCDVYMVMQLRHDEKILDERFASIHAYDLIHQYAALALTIAPENTKAYYWLIQSYLKQNMEEMATGELVAARQKLPDEEYQKLLQELKK